MAINTECKTLQTEIDHRKNVCSVGGENREKIVELSRSVACFVTQNGLNHDPVTDTYSISAGTPNLSQYIQKRYGKPLNDPLDGFRNELTWAFGTAFLVTDQVILTAAHCVCDPDGNVSQDLGEVRIVFGYQMVDETTCQTNFPASDVYKIDSIIEYQLHKPWYNKIIDWGNWHDWALIKLDKKVEGRDPIPLSTSPLTKSTKLGMLGYPTGLPLKWTYGAEVKETYSTKFDSNIDSFAGNSGSPVIRIDTWEVAGILCEGHLDYVSAPPHEYAVQLFRKSRFGVTGNERSQRTDTLTKVENYLTCRLSTQESPVEVVDAGLHLSVQCTNDACEKKNQPFWISRGVGTFDYAEESSQTKCPFCPKTTEVALIALKKSSYTIQGQLLNPDKKKIEKTGSTEGDKILVINQDDQFAWGYIKIICSKKLFSF